jgi:hypothetical protein
LVLDDGTRVETTIGNGWLVAWWPGSGEAKAVELTTAGGVTTQAIATRPVPPCPAGASCSSSQGGSGGAPGQSESGFSATGG